MKRLIIFTILLSAVLSGCGREDGEARTMPYIETVPPRSVTSPTFTGSTAEYYTAESTRAPMTGATGTPFYAAENINADTPDRNAAYENLPTETAADRDSLEYVRPDTAMGTEALLREPADTADTYR